MKRKGQMSSTFNYIFALIIGAIIFTFLVGFAYKYLGFAGSLGAAELVSSLNDEFSAFSVSDSAEKTLNFDSAVTFRIYEGKLTSKGQGRSIDHVIYAPFEVSGEDIFIATKSLELPYRVGNLFYITDQKTVYILVYDASTEQVIEELQSSYSSLPSNFATQVVSITQLSSDMETLAEVTSAYDRVRFVFFTSPAKVEDAISATFSNAEILSVDSSVDDYSSGEITFPDGETGIYVGYPLLIGGMVSGDAYSYNYNLDLVLEKLARVTSVYYDKSKFISARLPDCEYGPMKTALNNYRTFIGDTDTYTSYATKIALVEEANQDLGGECPEIY